MKGQTKMRWMFRILDALMITAGACIVVISFFSPMWWFAQPAAEVLLLVMNVFPSPYNWKYKKFRLRVCAGGADLLCAFLIAAVLTVIIHLLVLMLISDETLIVYLMSCAAAIIVLGAVLLNGVLRTYLSSAQLGIKHRVIGVLLSMIPLINLIFLIKVVAVCSAEAEFENNKDILNEQRKSEQICHTKYPILLVHGVFFRDFKHFNYWGRIPKELEKNGAVIYYGNHQSALAVAESGKELAQRIHQIIEETGYEKVNVIAHSKGGLDCRYAIAALGEDEHIASLTTINTPHRGCLFADYLLHRSSPNFQKWVHRTYNKLLRGFGDENPDFLSAVTDLTAENCEAFNQKIHDSGKVYYQSVGSKLNKAANATFPLNLTYNFVKRFDGDNDGLVSETSFEWGEKYTFLTKKGRRGISHSDMVDLNRENIKDFDVREFYVQLVADLKARGF